MSRPQGGRKTNIDMTEGVIWKQLVLFAIPLIMGNVFQQLYNTVDSIVVGNYLGTSALAAVGATTAICNTLVNFFNGISIGAGVVISTSFGAKNLEKLHEAVETTILFAVIVGCFVSLISIGVVPVMLKWMSTPDDVVGPAGEYLKIYFVGVPVLFLYNMGSAILRAVGDTRRPLLFLIISSCLNIVLDILFVAVFHWGISGVAIATVISSTSFGFLIRAEPSPFLTIFGTGQPMLISKISYGPSSRLAAISATISGSEPKSCRDTGRSRSSTFKSS